MALRRDPQLAFPRWQFRRQPGKKFDVLGLYENDRLAGISCSFQRPAPAHPPKAAIVTFATGRRESNEVMTTSEGCPAVSTDDDGRQLVTDVLDCVWKRGSGVGILAHQSSAAIHRLRLHSN